MAAQLIPRVGVQIYSQGVGPPPRTKPSNPEHTAHGPLIQITLTGSIQAFKAVDRTGPRSYVCSYKIRTFSEAIA
jgi:hypothetical protein